MSEPPGYEPARLARQPAAAFLVGALVLLVALAALLVPWDWVPRVDLSPSAPRGLFTADELSQIHVYATARRLVGLPAYFLSLAVAVVLGLTPWGARLVRVLTGRLRWWAAVPVAVLALLLIGRLVTLPLAVVGQRLDLAYQLSTQSWVGWAADLGKAFGVNWIGTSLALLVLVGLARRFRRWWFAPAAAVAAVLVVLGSFAYPVLVQPLFSDFRPLRSGPLRQAVFALADEAGVNIDEVLVSDASQRTTAVNAYVTGFAGTRRVVVYDTLLHRLPPAQVRVVVAHELGHAKNDDVLVGTILGAVGTFAAVCALALLLSSPRLRRRAGAVTPAEPAVVALVLALYGLGLFAVSPLQNTVSRAVEARADRVALELTHDPEAFVAMQHALAVRSLTDPDPPPILHVWFGTHPTTMQRVAIPEALRQAGRL